ncbi:MAG: 2-amino-4-hydroxy-6-hydroxymethyldihydropteridine diphosphokinase [Candidatus Dormibacteria bacterium]
MDSESIFLCLGSNLGDRAANLSRAVAELEDQGVRVLRASAVRETEPWGPVAQPSYLNQVLQVTTELEPRDLLRAAKEAERRVGRVAGERWGPREIDVDILFYGERVIDEPDLTIPHPMINQRPFVLETWRG